MSTDTLREFHLRFTGLSLPVLVICLSFSLSAAFAQDNVIQQANVSLTQAVKSGGATAASTSATLITRHNHLVEVFRTHPETARSYMLDAATRTALLQAQPSNASLIEQDQPLTGELVSAVADDFVNHVSREQYSLHGKAGDRGLSFTARRDDLHRMLHHQVTVTGLSLPEIVAAETLREATPAETQAAALAPDSASTANTATTLVSTTPAAVTPAVVTGASVAPGSATQLEIPLGPQTTAVLILKFATGTIAFPTGLDQPSYYQKVFAGPATPNIASFMDEVSYHQTSVSTDVYGPISVPGNFNCNTTDSMATAAIAAATSTVDFTKYNHIVFAFPSHGCYFGGLGSTGPQSATTAITHQFTYIWLPIEDTYDATNSYNFIWLATNHEFGHNLGLNHGNSIDFGTIPLGPIDFASVNPGTVTPGGHAPDAEALAPGSADVNVAASPTQTAVVSTLTPAVAPTGSTAITAINTEYGDKFANMGDGQAPFSGQHHVQELGWIPASGNQDVTTSGSFTIFPTETNSGLRTLHVLRDPVSSSWIWVEFHQSLGIYTPLALMTAPYNVPNNVLSGALLHYQNGFGDQLHTLLMDMTATSSPNGFFNSNLVPGASWSDPFSLLTITAGTQSANSLGISVSYDTPCATVSLATPTVAAAGGSDTVNLTAPASCNWSVSSNAPWISFTGATTGSGNGTVSFTAAPNKTGGQLNTYITAQRQSLSFVQEGTGISVVALLPATNTAAPGSSVPLVITLRDTLGVADLSQINFTIQGGTNPDCVIAAVNNGNSNSIDLYLSTNGTYSSAVTTGAAGTLSNSSCTINTVNSTYSASGKDAKLTLLVSFPSTFPGVHNITASGQGTNGSATIPVGFVNVTGTAAPSVVMSPASASVPVSGAPGTTVAFTITAVNTAFTSGSTVQVGGTGVSVSGVTLADENTLTGNLVLNSNASLGVQSVTVTSGSAAVTTNFTVFAPAPSITLSPSSGNKGTTTTVDIIGSDVKFVAGSTVAVSGKGLAVNNIKRLSNTELKADFVIDDDAAASVRTVTVTSGTDSVKASFTVNPEVIPTVVATPASANRSDSTFVTFTGTNTNFTTATTIAVTGSDITIKDPIVLDSYTLTARFIVASNATTGAHQVIITTGGQVATTTFNITAFKTTQTTIESNETTLPGAGSVILTATVTPTSGSGIPDGYVSFIEHKDGAGLDDILGTVALSDGNASLPVSNLTPGVHTFIAQYLGDNKTFAHSNSTVAAKVTVQ